MQVYSAIGDTICKLGINRPFRAASKCDGDIITTVVTPEHSTTESNEPVEIVALQDSNGRLVSLIASRGNETFVYDGAPGAFPGKDKAP